MLITYNMTWIMIVSNIYCIAHTCYRSLQVARNSIANVAHETKKQKPKTFTLLWVKNMFRKISTFSLFICFSLAKSTYFALSFILIQCIQRMVIVVQLLLINILLLALTVFFLVVYYPCFVPVAYFLLLLLSSFCYFDCFT